MQELYASEAVSFVSSLTLGTKTRAQLDIIDQDHDRLRSQFMAEVHSRLTRQHQQLMKNLMKEEMKDEMVLKAINLTDIVMRYRNLVSDLIAQEQLDLRISCSMDAFEANLIHDSCPKVTFQYPIMFDMAKALEVEVRQSLLQAC
jgi:hypothetical protein